MAIKPLPKGKSLKEIHDWWNYGINPITGMRDHIQGRKKSDNYSLYVEYIQNNHDKKSKS